MFKRKTLNLSEKLDVIREIDNSPHIRKRDIAAKHGIPVNTLCTIYANRERIIEQSTKNFVNLKMKKIRASTYPDIEDSLMDWYAKNHSQKGNGYVSGIILRMKALQLARTLGHDNFSASNGWIERFKTRHNIPGKKPSKKNRAADVEILDHTSDADISTNPTSNMIWENISNPVVDLKEFDEVYTGTTILEEECDLLNHSQSYRPVSHQGNFSNDIIKTELQSSFLEPNNNIVEYTPLRNGQENKQCPYSVNVEMISNDQADEALNVLYRYFKSYENKSERNFQLLDELSIMVNEVKQARKQSKITDFFYSMSE